MINSKVQLNLPIRSSHLWLNVSSDCLLLGQATYLVVGLVLLFGNYPLLGSNPSP